MKTKEIYATAVKSILEHDMEKYRKALQESIECIESIPNYSIVQGGRIRGLKQARELFDIWFEDIFDEIYEEFRYMMMTKFLDEKFHEHKED